MELRPHATPLHTILMCVPCRL